MFNRIIEKELLLWKNSQKRKVLILQGARQVGKTSTIRKFAKENFVELIELNLEKNEQKQWFCNVLSIDDFAKRIELNLGKKLIDQKSLLFIDEAQELTEVMELLRFFAEERPNLHVIVAGSLMNIKLTENKWSVPVGRVEYLYMYPANFFEYLGVRNSYLKETLLKIKKPSDLTLSVHNKAKEMYEEYLIVGGMPEIVADFQKNESILSIQEIQSRLYNSYKDDADKYVTKEKRKYLEVVFSVTPKLAGSIFTYTNMGQSGYKSREIAEATKILEKTMLLTQVMATNTVNLPILTKYKRPKKMIWLDVGLVNYANQMQEIKKQLNIWAT